VWERVNRCFDRLPLSCVVDKEIFCVHGGIPRQTSSEYNELKSIMNVPVVSGVMPAYDYESEEAKQVCTDCLWSDPAKDEDETPLDGDGFGESVRGGSTSTQYTPISLCVELIFLSLSSLAFLRSSGFSVFYLSLSLSFCLWFKLVCQHKICNKIKHHQTKMKIRWRCMLW
jgi:hypothetical protein